MTDVMYRHWETGGILYPHEVAFIGDYVLIADSTTGITSDIRMSLDAFEDAYEELEYDEAEAGYMDPWEEQNRFLESISRPRW